MTDPLAIRALKPGSVIGILGGGQLGRMLAIAAARLGLRCHIYDPASGTPAGEVSAAATSGAWEDQAALKRFAEAVDVITYEFENVPIATLDYLEFLRPVRPGRTALATAQDRLEEKRFLAGLGLTTAPFAPLGDAEDLDAALTETGLPAILKTRRMGYDGKGQKHVATREAARRALTWSASGDLIAEGVVAFEREVSVIGARSAAGEVVCFDAAENLHEGGILRRSTVPAALSLHRATDAALATGRILNALDYVGVIGVEFFVTPQGLLVNEFAPRVHNSGHWTLEACQIDQFEQHIRAIAGWPLGDGARHADAVMDNLIGEDAAGWAEIAADPAAKLHLYGKAEIREGRKMGHVTRLSPRR
ncbi:MAG: 5-(carboxyamino)imidazole ribonucleotide synthase [Pseudomonadota bacterium]